MAWRDMNSYGLSFLTEMQDYDGAWFGCNKLATVASNCFEACRYLYLNLKTHSCNCCSC